MVFPTLTGFSVHPLRPVVPEDPARHPLDHLVLLGEAKNSGCDYPQHEWSQEQTSQDVVAQRTRTGHGQFLIGVEPLYRNDRPSL